jgi:hypothetical protein
MSNSNVDYKQDRNTHELLLQRAKALGISIDSFATQTLPTLNVSDDRPLHTFKVSQALRGICFFRGILTTADLCLVGPAGALLRCMLEQYFVGCAIARNSKHLFDLLETHNFQRRGALRGLLSVPEEHCAANSTKANIEEALNQIDRESQETKIKEWAALANCGEAYVTTYAYLCKYVHASLKACDEHLVLDGDKLLGVTTTVDDAVLPTFIVNSCSMMLFFLSEVIDQRISHSIFLDNANRECSELMTIVYR